MTYDRSWLEAEHRKAPRSDFLFFWGHRPSRDGRINASCLSQWWPSPFKIDGLAYPTAEHWMMAAKARLFGDLASGQKVLKAKSPKEAKELGRQVSGFDKQTWDDAKRRIVSEGTIEKFRQNEALRAFLVSTGSRVLVEASPVDTIWGIGLAANDERSGDPSRWRGENLLGFILMETRDHLRRST